MRAMESGIAGDIRGSAIRIIIRLALGEYTATGPRENILELESRVAWATVCNELQNEGYMMVSPEEYANAYGLPLASVIDRMEGAGSLFALVFRSGGQTSVLVPLEEKEEREGLGPILK